MEEFNMKKGEKRKLELLKIAYEMFVSKGYENTSVDEIIEKAGIAKGTFYYHFKSKEQMLEEVIDMMLDEQAEKAGRILEAQIPIPQKLVGIIASFRTDEEEETIKAALHAPENIVMHQKTEKKLRERLVPILSDLTRQGISEGIFSCDDIPERMNIIVILANELFDTGDFTDSDIRVFIDVVENTLHARKGSMGFIEGFIKGGN